MGSSKTAVKAVNIETARAKNEALKKWCREKMNKFYEHALSLLFFSGWVQKKGKKTEGSILKGCIADL